ncbi:hypothetical protein [Petrachloros mirabilis]
MGSLDRHGQQRDQPLQIQETAYQIRFIEELEQATALKAAEPMSTFRFAPQIFDPLPDPLHEPIPRRLSQSTHPLMHGLLSDGFGRNVRRDPSFHAVFRNAWATYPGLH